MGMTSRDRVLGAILHQTTDCVPVAPFIGHYAAWFSGIKIKDYITDGRLIAKAQYRLWEQLQQDVVITAADTYYIAEAFGLEVHYPDDALPTAGAVPVTDLKKAATLRIPDPLKDGRMPVYIEAVAELKSLFHGSVAIRGTGTGPFSLAAYVMGIQDFLTKLMDIETGLAESWEEAALRGLLDLMSDTLIAFLKAQILAGVDIAYIGDSLASMNMISPGMYRSFAYPYHKKVIDAVQPLCQSYGAHTVLHICGDNLAILDDLAATGVDMLDIDSRMDLAECKRRIGDQVCLVGNLDPVHMIMEGTVQEVDLAARQCIDQAGNGGGFILSTGCFVPLHTPLDNLKQMVTVARTRKP